LEMSGNSEARTGEEERGDMEEEGRMFLLRQTVWGVKSSLEKGEGGEAVSKDGEGARRCETVGVKFKG